MAKKIALAAALLASLMALAAALDDQANPWREQECESEIQGRQFRSCQMYLQSRSSSPYMGSEGEFLEMNQQQYLTQCCRDLWGVKDECRCEAIKHAVRQSLPGQMQEQVYQRARNIPRYCRFPQQQCQIRAVFV